MYSAIVSFVFCSRFCSSIYPSLRSRAIASVIGKRYTRLFVPSTVRVLEARDRCEDLRDSDKDVGWHLNSDMNIVSLNDAVDIKCSQAFEGFAGTLACLINEVSDDRSKFCMRSFGIPWPFVFCSRDNIP